MYFTEYSLAALTLQPGRPAQACFALLQLHLSIDLAEPFLARRLITSPAKMTNAKHLVI